MNGGPPKINIRERVLAMADGSAPLPFKPMLDSLIAPTTWAVEHGYLERSLLGGFVLTAAGSRALAAMRARRKA